MFKVILSELFCSRNSVHDVAAWTDNNITPTASFGNMMRIKYM
jgi:hypothetical protein